MKLRRLTTIGSFLVLLIAHVSTADASCKAISAGSPHSTDWTLYDAQGVVVGFGTGMQRYTTGTNGAGSATGTGSGATYYTDGTTTGTFTWTFTVTGFSTTTCSGALTVFFNNAPLHSGRFTVTDNMFESNYIGFISVDPASVNGAKTIRSRSRIQ